MIFQFFLIVVFLLFSLTRASHFLGGSFTYRHIEQPINHNSYESIVVEIRFHMSDHYFICTPEQINEHMIVYFIGESVPYDEINHRYLWYETESIKRNKYFYNIECMSDSHNRACKHFQEKTWAYCESANQNNGYSILRRQFLLIFEKYKPIQLRYSSCCWANSTVKNFHLELSIETKLNRINSSPYPHIPASYYVDFNEPRDIKIYVFDADNDEIVCERFKDDLGGFLTVHADANCKLTYQTNRLGKQFGQFWLMDRNNNQILSRSLISIQIHVLKDIICNVQPEIVVENKADHSNISTIKIKQSVNLTVNLNPNCLLIEPQDQTITELTTLCTNNQPVVSANGGIEVIFQCSPDLCEKYQICFVGEFSRKLPSTEIKCFSIQVIGTDDECAHASSNRSFLKPPNRHFVIAEPITRIESTITSTALSSKSIASKTTSTLPWPISKASLSSEAKSRRWLWISATVMFSLFIGFIGYVGFKKKLITFMRHSLDSDGFRLSSRSDSSITITSDVAPIYPSSKQINASPGHHSSYDDSPGSPKRVKIRAQHIRLGALDEED
ncbi:unnamed protein product [Rotaria socialis]|uniref:Uncharacterized protein n=1 Tax=Rotaria socialis TaxID=392032 RepID=A0A818B1N9_9BILA|nr:unnamed protein product [Rotaria socialis]